MILHQAQRGASSCPRGASSAGLSCCLPGRGRGRRPSVVFTLTRTTVPDQAAANHRPGTRAAVILGRQVLGAAVGNMELEGRGGGGADRGVGVGGQDGPKVPLRICSSPVGRT